MGKGGSGKDTQLKISTFLQHYLQDKEGDRLHKHLLQLTVILVECVTGI